MRLYYPQRLSAACPEATRRQMEGSEEAGVLAPHVWGMVGRCLLFREAEMAMAACDVSSVRCPFVCMSFLNTAARVQ